MRRIEKGLVIAMIMIVGSSCSDNEPDIKPAVGPQSGCPEELAGRMAADPLFLDVRNKTEAFLLDIQKIVREEGISGEQLRDIPEERTPGLFGLDGLDPALEDALHGLVRRFSLDGYDEEAIQAIVGRAMASKSSLPPLSPAKSDECQENFEDDFNEAHSSYLSSLVNCGIVTLFNPGAGALCTLGATGRVIYDMAVAMDEYFDCVEKS